MSKSRIFIGALFLSLIAIGTAAQPEANAGPGDLTLWYRRPATQWVEALPVGNGRLGAMVFGGPQLERLQLNEDTLWAGGPYNPANPEAKAALPEIRRLVAAGEHLAAQNLVQQKFMSIPVRQASYQTVGDVLVTMAGSYEAMNYRRELDLDTAIVRTQFDLGSTRHTREVFASPVDQVIVMRLAAGNVKRPEQPATFSFSVAMQTPQTASVNSAGNDTLIMRGTNGPAIGNPGALKFEARVRVIVEGGTVTSDSGQLHIENARSAVLLIAAATSFRRFDDVSGDPSALNSATIAAAAGKSFDSMRDAHIAEHQRLFRRVAVDLGNTEAGKLPTDERIRNIASVDDPQLAALYFQYARYLLICSSRPGTQPANLQGIWNDSLTPSWGSKYTININTEMNYWPAEVANLSECVEPLFGMIRDLTETGSRLAREHYGINSGWVTHHNTDLWRAAGPIDSALYGMWPCGGAWLCRHLWEHYLYSGDRQFLERAYPLMKGSAEFFLEALVPDPTGRYLITSPSMSPENSHHKGVTTVGGPTMDNQILRDLFTQCIEASKLMGVDESFREKLVATRARLAPNRIGAQGQLQEWLEDWDATAPDPQHRHVSHLYGFFPSDQITLRGTPELAKAVRTTLEARGDFSTGWAIAWRLNLWARMQDAERAHTILRALLGPERTYPNMFDAHPPFQIDGNFGGASGIAEMLLQTHTGEIELLPALPKAWPTGSVKGLRARGGFEVDIQWKDGRLVSATLRSRTGGTARLRSGSTLHTIEVSAGMPVTWKP